MTITEEQRKQLLHAYETLMFPVNRLEGHLTKDEKAILTEAWLTVTTILVASLKESLHGGGEWLGEDDMLNKGHWDAIR